jgi:hypothetical protein
MFSSAFIGVVEKSEVSQINSNNHVLLGSSDILALGNKLDSIDLLMPYGSGCLPPPNSAAVFVPIGGSSKTFKCLGFTPIVPDIPHTIMPGEYWNNSQKYILLMQNDAIRAYRNTDQEFNCTLPNGEAVVQLLLDRIDELQSMISDINSNYSSLLSTFNAHNHPNGKDGNPTGAPTTTLSQTDIPDYATLAKDKTYLTDGKALINDLGANYE